MSTDLLHSQGHHRNLIPETDHLRAKMLSLHKKPLESPSAQMKQFEGHLRDAGGCIGVCFTKEVKLINSFPQIKNGTKPFLAEDRIFPRKGQQGKWIENHLPLTLGRKG